MWHCLRGKLVFTDQSHDAKISLSFQSRYHCDYEWKVYSFSCYFQDDRVSNILLALILRVDIRHCNLNMLDCVSFFLTFCHEIECRP
jgi:hypothetical protein